jgi:undecaprenyl pyrophosphate phosphatase UppP
MINKWDVIAYLPLVIIGLIFLAIIDISLRAKLFVILIFAVFTIFLILIDKWFEFCAKMKIKEKT